MADPLGTHGIGGVDDPDTIIDGSNVAAGRKPAVSRLPFGVWVAALVGLAGRMYAIFVHRPTCERAEGLGGRPLSTDGCFAFGGDVLFVEQQGELIGKGEWFKNGFDYWAGGLLQDSASRPPLFPLLIGVLAKLGIRDDDLQRAVMSLFGVAAIIGFGWIGRRLAGDRAAVIAAGLAALHPLLWIGDFMMMSEALFVPLIVAVIVASYRYLDAPTWGRLLTLAVVITLAGLVRTEGMFLHLLLLVPLVLRSQPAWRDRLASIGVSALVALALLSPWLAFNNARFSQPVTMTSSTGWVLFAGSCDSAWEGQYIGYWAAGCLETRDLAAAYDQRFPGHRTIGAERVLYDESEVDGWYRDQAVNYYRANAGRFPLVAAARIGRSLEVFNAGQGLWLDHQIEGRPRAPATVGLIGYYLLVPLAALGALVLRRADEPLWPVAVMWPLILLTVIFTYGITRYRVPIDVAMVILAAVVINAIVDRLRTVANG